MYIVYNGFSNQLIPYWFVEALNEFACDIFNDSQWLIPGTYNE